MFKSLMVILIDVAVVWACWKMVKSITRPAGLKMINPVSMMLLKDFIVYGLVGTSFFLMGLGTDYYLFRLASDGTMQYQVWFIVLYCMIVVFGMLAVLNSVTRGRLTKAFETMNSMETNNRGDLNTSLWVWAFLVEEMIFYVYYCFLMSYVPLFKIFTAGGYELSALRFSDKFNYSGNSIIRNVSFFILPFLSSYASLVLLRKDPKSKERRIQFYLAVFLSFLCLTSRFEKSYLIYYLIGFLFLPRSPKVVNIGAKEDNKQKRKSIVLLALIVLFAFIYTMFLTGTDEAGSIFHRVFYSEIIGLFGHLIVFPFQHAFLEFQYYPGLIANLFGKQEIRSSRIVMKALYNTQYSGHMNSLFAAEAYANGGWVSLFLSPFIVAMSIFVVYYILSKLKRSPITTAAIIYFAINTPIVGGFLDFFYNPTIIIVLLLVFAVNYIVFIPKEKIKYRIMSS